VTHAFDFEGVRAVLADLRRRGEQFLRETGADPADATIEFSASARYPYQNWELDLPLRSGAIDSPEAVEQIRADFHTLHEELFAISEPHSHVEFVGWRARVSASVGSSDLRRVRQPEADVPARASRMAHFPGFGEMSATVVLFDGMRPGERLDGPVIVESPITTVVVDPGSSVERRGSGSLVVTSTAERESPNPTTAMRGAVA
jgi:N-methylhydantoinase A